MCDCPGKECVGGGVLELGRGGVIQQPEGAGELVAGAGGVYSERTPEFSEFSPGFLHDEGEVTIMRRGQFQGVLQLDLPGRALQQVGAPYDVANTSGRIVHDNGELVGNDPVPAADDRVTQYTHIELTVTLDTVRP